MSYCTPAAARGRPWVSPLPCLSTLAQSPALEPCLSCPQLMPACSQVGIKVRELQAQLPKARVVYCSATGASGRASGVVKGWHRLLPCTSQPAQLESTTTLLGWH